MLDLRRPHSCLEAYNLSRNYDSKYVGGYKNRTDAKMARISESLIAKLQKQQELFIKFLRSRNTAIKTSFVISHETLRVVSHLQRDSSSKNAWWTPKC